LLISLVKAETYAFDEYELETSYNDFTYEDDDVNDLDTFLEFFDNNDDVDFFLSEGLKEGWNSFKSNVKQGWSNFKTNVGKAADATTHWIAERGDKINNAMGAIKKSTSFAKTAALVTAGVGVVAAPFTGGASLGLTGAAMSAYGTLKTVDTVTGYVQEGVKTAVAGAKGYDEARQAGKSRKEAALNGLKTGGVQALKSGVKIGVGIAAGKLGDKLADGLGSSDLGSSISSKAGDFMKKHGGKFAEKMGEEGFKKFTEKASKFVGDKAADKIVSKFTDPVTNTIKNSVNEGMDIATEKGTTVGQKIGKIAGNTALNIAKGAVDLAKVTTKAGRVVAAVQKGKEIYDKGKAAFGIGKDLVTSAKNRDSNGVRNALGRARDGVIKTATGMSADELQGAKDAVKFIGKNSKKAKVGIAAGMAVGRALGQSAAVKAGAAVAMAGKLAAKNRFSSPLARRGGVAGKPFGGKGIKSPSPKFAKKGGLSKAKSVIKSSNRVLKSAKSVAPFTKRPIKRPTSSARKGKKK